MERSQESSNLLDTHNRLIADVLARFRMLTMLATIQAEGETRNADPQTIAVTGISMQLEFEGLVRSGPSFPASPPHSHSFQSILTPKTNQTEHLHQGSVGSQSPPQGALALRPSRRRGRNGQSPGRAAGPRRRAMRRARQFHPGQALHPLGHRARGLLGAAGRVEG